VASWSFLTNHGRALLCLARHPEARLRDIAAELGITERRAYGIVADLTTAGYVIKSRQGRRNRYEICDRLPLPEPNTRQGAIGEMLTLLGNSRRGSPSPGENDQGAKGDRRRPSTTEAASRQAPGGHIGS
jgi:hypothetical protein